MSRTSMNVLWESIFGFKGVIAKPLHSTAQHNAVSKWFQQEFHSYGYTAELLGNRMPRFRASIVSSSSKVQMSKKTFLDIWTLVGCEKGVVVEFFLLTRKCTEKQKPGESSGSNL